MGRWVPLWPHPRAHYVQRIHLVTAAIQLLPLMAGRAVWSWTTAGAVTAGLWLLVVSRLGILIEDRPRPRWVVRAVDEPVFCHWGACAFGLPVFALGLGAVVLAAWLTGPRLALETAAGAAPAVAAFSYLTALPVAAWSLWGIRRQLRIRSVEVTLLTLPCELDGYRLVLLSDLHIGSFDTRARGREWAALANLLDPDLCVVTGDLLTSGIAFHADAADVVGALRAKDGVFATLGNHDQQLSDDLVARLASRGACVLRNEWRGVERGAARLTIAGVDDCYTHKADLERTLAGRPPDAITVLLAHDPSVGDEAARRGVELVLSGHTHGGQIGLPGLGDRINLTLLMGQPRSGLHRRGDTWHFVSAGLGNTGPPLRLAIPPEIGLIVLRSGRCNIRAPS